MNMSTQTANLNLSYLVQKQNCLLSTTENILKSSSQTSHDVFRSLLCRNQELKYSKGYSDTADKKEISKTISSVLTGSSEQKLLNTLVKCNENESTGIYENVLSSELNQDDADTVGSSLKNTYKEVGNLLTLMHKSTICSIPSQLISDCTELFLLKHLGTHLKDLLNAENFLANSSSLGASSSLSKEIGSVYILIMNLISKDKFLKNESRLKELFKSMRMRKKKEWLSLLWILCFKTDH